MPTLVSGPDELKPRRAFASARPFLLGCCLLLLALEVWGTLCTLDPHHPTGFSIYYGAGSIVRTHPSMLYDPATQIRAQQMDLSTDPSMSYYLHPSYEALLYAPFTFIPLRPAFLLYMVFCTMLLVAIFFAARALYSQRIRWIQPRPGLMLVLFFPIAATIGLSQDSILFLLLCTLAWRALEKGNDALAGCLLGLAVFKYQVAVPIALLFAIRRSWRFSAGFLATAAAAALLSFALVGKAGTAAMQRLVALASLSKSQDFHAQHATGIHPTGMPNLTGLLYVAGTRHLPAHVAMVIVGLASLGLALWTFLRIRREPSDAVAFAMAILCAMLVSYHLFVYELALLALPMALLAGRVHPLALLSFYVLPIALLLTLGAHSFFLLAIPILALLIYAGTAKQTLRAGTDTPQPAPLYT